ncbi:MAG: hypothetical protein ACT4TC_26950 [Myxococcaceae bacterium]
MLLFQKRFHAGLLDGSVRLTFRRWASLRVKPQGRYRCHPIGVLEVDSVSWVLASSLTDLEARAAGFTGLGELTAFLEELGPLPPSTRLARVELHHGGDGDRVQLAMEDKLSKEEVETLRAKLKKMDGRKPWTLRTLRLIQKRPRVAASKLALSVGRETLPFKVDVRKLKKLGLTQSFEVGYEVSPRGTALLKKLGKNL